MSKHSDDGELHFHYSRSDRLTAGGHDRGETKKGSVFRRNRSLTIVLIDIAIIVVIYLLFAFVFNAQPKNESYGGYDFTLRAVSFADEVLCTLTVQHANPSRDVAGQPATVTFESGAAEKQVSDLLPSGSTGKRVFRARLPGDESSGEVRATITIGDHRLRLESGIDTE